MTPKAPCVATPTPRGALLLLDYYLSHHPGGRLAEQALALSIEAAAAADQPLRARALARRYLREYPLGAHTDRARHVAAGESESGFIREPDSRQDP